MHANHLILVKADDWESAISEAEDFLKDYGNGNVWDWYEIGGRWSWKENDDQYHSDRKSNVLEISKNKAKAKKLIKEMLKYQEDYVKRYNNDLVNEMKDRNVIHLKHLKPSEKGLVGYYVYQLGSLIAGYYIFDSHFYDVDYGSAYIDDERIEQVLKTEGMWLVNIDLHN